MSFSNAHLLTSPSFFIPSRSSYSSQINAVAAVLWEDFFKNSKFVQGMREDRRRYVNVVVSESRHLAVAVMLFTCVVLPVERIHLYFTLSLFAFELDDFFRFPSCSSFTLSDLLLQKDSLSTFFFLIHHHTPPPHCALLPLLFHFLFLFLPHTFPLFSPPYPLSHSLSSLVRCIFPFTLPSPFLFTLFSHFSSPI